MPTVGFFKPYFWGRLNIILTSSFGGHHRLGLSRFTSFVAVEEQPVRAADEPLNSQLVPNLNPVDHRLYPQTSLGLNGLWALALALLLAGLLILNWKPRHA